LHVIEGLRAGADWDVTFIPFSLRQMHVEEGDPDVWDQPAGDSGLLALEVGTLVRDLEPGKFLDVHEALFHARHVTGEDLRDLAVLRRILEEHGVDADRVLAETDSTGLDTVHKEHDAAVAEGNVWGVPTFMADGQAVFVRLMDGPEGDAELAQKTVERVLDLVTGWPELNEFKHTSIAR
ncbi:MAG TPA: DsbA family protein, partial [Acidimicrobiales bacterium]|nr:DsbA family protein [Acidimicrobiales bacterium]